MAKHGKPDYASGQVRCRCQRQQPHATVTTGGLKEEQFLRDDGRGVQPAPAGRRVHYERRRPQDTVLYQLVQEHLETFLAQVELETGVGLPEFVKEEFDAFLDCGILARGFLRLRCADCGHEKLVAFSCKKRGFCTGCGARRMA